MFLYYYLAGWLHRACWRLGHITNGTAPSFRTAWWAYGLWGWRR